MTTTELDEVQALLEHVLPDPAGYAQRLLMQAMTRWGQAASPPVASFYSAAHADHPAARADVVDSEVVIGPGQPTVDEPPINTNLLLAAALGACECWGLAADCDLCRGQGSAGWTEPDPELFAEFVEPAITRLTRNAPDPRESGSSNEDNKATSPSA